MERREFLAALGASAAAWGISWPVAALAQGGADASFAALLDRLFYDNLLIEPTNATSLGLDRGVRAALRSRLGDNSPAGRAMNTDFDRRALTQIRAVDPATLGDAGRRNRDVVAYMFEQRLAGVRFGIEQVQQPYPITQQQGAYFDIPDFLDSQHPVETADDAEAYLARLHAFGFSLDEDTSDQTAKAARGIAAPGWSLDLALGQIRQMLAPAPEANPMVQSLVRRTAAKGIAGDWQARAAMIVGAEIYPALDRQAALIARVRRTTRAGDGAWRMPKGDEIYAAALRQATTTDNTPEQIHKIGLAQVADISAQLDAILKGAGYTTGTVGERLTALNHAPDQLYPETDEGRTALIASLNAGMAAMAGRLPRAFNDAPSEPLEIRRVPPEIQDGASNGYYYSAALDGSRPAIYWINLKSVGDWPKYSLPALTYHEGIPGHHLQGGYSRAGGALPMYLKDYFISSYGEGWALYAEQLADELGAFTAIERAGYLQSFLFRAARLVIDTGLHHYKWSREKATDYMVQTVGFARPRSQREVERYCTLIGQACSYKMGHTAWVAARTKAQAALGDKFTLPWFHDILKEGAMPLFMLEKRIDERVKERLKA
ncbi:MAG: Tat pathway signal protein [Novosphingobium sp. 12-64-8]|nr:MAG: Tat pathway signal protein [Novosphingobium sp. 12-64-8]